MDTFPQGRLLDPGWTNHSASLLSAQAPSVVTPPADPGATGSWGTLPLPADPRALLPVNPSRSRDLAALDTPAARVRVRALNLTDALGGFQRNRPGFMRCVRSVDWALISQ